MYVPERVRRGAARERRTMNQIPEQRTPADFLADALDAQGGAHFPNCREQEGTAAQREIVAIAPDSLHVRTDDGSVSVNRYDDPDPVFKAIGRLPRRDDRNLIVVHLSEIVHEDRCDAVMLHPDQWLEVETLDRAIETLEVAREAFSRSKW